MNWFTKLFKKPQEIVQTYHVIATGSFKTCPKCRTDGGFFSYEEGFLSPGSEPFYLCENCCKRTSVDEYNHFLRLNPTEKDKKEYSTIIN